MANETENSRLPFLNPYLLKGSVALPLGGLASGLLSYFIPGFAINATLPLAILLVLSLHRIFWKRNPLVGAHVSWFTLGASIPVFLTLLAQGNFLPGAFLVFIFLFALWGRSTLNAALRKARS